MRVIIQSESRGTLLTYEGFFGWALFSRDPGDIVDQERAKQMARTFADAAEAQAFIERIGGVTEADAEEPEPFPSDLSFVAVETTAEYAPMAVCVAAGVQSWNASDGKPIAPCKVDVHESRVSHTTVVGLTGSGKLTLHARRLQTTLTKEAIAELRRAEEGCHARIISIKRKLAADSAAVTPELLLQWERTLSEVRAQLIAAGEDPMPTA
jgi:hypothetical protein